MKKCTIFLCNHNDFCNNIPFLKLLNGYIHESDFIFIFELKQFFQVTQYLETDSFNVNLN
jgi:hypothetical protein